MSFALSQLWSRSHLSPWGWMDIWGMEMQSVDRACSQTRNRLKSLQSSRSCTISSWYFRPFLSKEPPLLKALTALANCRRDRLKVPKQRWRWKLAVLRKSLGSFVERRRAREVEWEGLVKLTLRLTDVGTIRKERQLKPFPRKKNVHKCLTWNMSLLTHNHVSCIKGKHQQNRHPTLQVARDDFRFESRVKCECDAIC